MGTQKADATWPGLGAAGGEGWVGKDRMAFKEDDGGRGRSMWQHGGFGGGHAVQCGGSEYGGTDGK